MQIERVRVSTSPNCELNCSYCDKTQSKSQRLTKILPPISRQNVFSCNTIYRNDIQQVLQSHSENIFEVHFSALISERKNNFSSELLTNGNKLIVIIDHFDESKILKLSKWNHQVEEYRIIPSRLYSATYYLNKLPHFIQNKIAWAFPREQESIDPLLSPDEVHWTLKDLQKSPFASQATSHHMWNKTWDTSLHHYKDEKKYITIFVNEGEELSLPHLNVRKISNLPIASCAIELSLAQSLYVGYFDHVNDDILEQIQGRDFDLLYCTPKSLVQAPIVEDDFSIKLKSFFLLENFLVRRDLWTDYLNSTECIGEVSWNEFIKAQTIITKEAVVESTKNHRVEKLNQELQNHYYTLLSNDSYKSLFLNFGKNSWSRHVFFYFFHFIYTLTNFIPKKHQDRVAGITQQTSLITQSAAGHLGDELRDTKKTLWKSILNFKFGLFRLYWLGYHKLSEFYGQIIKRYVFGRLLHKYLYRTILEKYIFGIFLRGFLWGYCIKRSIWGQLLNKYLYGLLFKHFLYGFLWSHLLYGKVWCGTRGFLTSLSDFPQDYSNLNTKQRRRAKIQFVAKKFGWLALRTVGLK